MSFILTFLGKGGTGRTTTAIAAAKRFSACGKRTLFITQDSSPVPALLWGTPLTVDPQPMSPNLDGMQLHTTALLERSWEELKQQEAQYLRTPFFKAVYGQELGVLPGMDTALALNALREQDATGKYDVIVYDGNGDQDTLRMLGMPEILTWYIRRFRQVFAESDFAKTVVPLLQPIAATVLNVSWTGDMFDQPATKQVNNILEDGKAAVTDPHRVAAYLVSTGEPEAIAQAKYLWGCAQQVGLTVGGAIVNRTLAAEPLAAEFDPLPITALPDRIGESWQPVIDALPDFAAQVTQVPRPMAINVSDRKVLLFLPGFDKKQVKLTQYGPEVTIEAGDQRRNIVLPPELRGKPVTGAKFQDGYLMISF